METTDLGSDSDRANLSLYYYLANLQRFRYTEYIVANQLPVRQRLLGDGISWKLPKQQRLIDTQEM